MLWSFENDDKRESLTSSVGTDCFQGFPCIMVESTDPEPSDMEGLLPLWDPKRFLLSPHIQTLLAL